MPTFDTPEPITATIDVAVGDVRVTAGDGTATVVDVRPSDASNTDDVKAAELTRVEYASGQLLVKAPKLRSWLSRSGGGSVDVTIELPAGSQVHGAGQTTDFRFDGRLGDSRIKTGMGNIALDQADTAEPEERHRRRHRGPRDGPRRDRDRVGRRARAASSPAAR